MIFWLSFADPERPTGTQFLGACMVEADSPIAAVKTAHALGINPGGEVMILEQAPADVVHPSWLNVLMDRETIRAHDSKEGWARSRVH